MPSALMLILCSPLGWIGMVVAGVMVHYAASGMGCH